MKFHYYHKVSGELHTYQVATNIEDESRALYFANANAPADHIPIKGSFDRAKHRIDVATGECIGRHQ
jgi:hypothetical protein